MPKKLFRKPVLTAYPLCYLNTTSKHIMIPKSATPSTRAAARIIFARRSSEDSGCLAIASSAPLPIRPTPIPAPIAAAPAPSPASPCPVVTSKTINYRKNNSSWIC
jgi:hypothetical protein